MLLTEPGLEAEATIVLYAGDYWMAKPDASTYSDTPLPPEIEAEIERNQHASDEVKPS